MKKKLISALLCLVLVLSSVPAQFLGGISTKAYGLDEDGLPEIKGATFSKGLWQERGMVTADIMPEITDDEEPQGHHMEDRWTISVGSFSLYDWETRKSTPSGFYFPKSQGAVSQRLTLWSNDPMDTSKLTLSGAELSGSFTRGMIGTTDPDRGMAAYYYQATVSVPAEDGWMEVFYDGVSLGMVRIEHIETESTYISELYVTQKNDDGTYTIEFGGVNMPQSISVGIGEHQWDSNYNMTDELLMLWQSDTVSAPDSNGVYTAVVSSTGNTPEMDSWYPLTINGSMANYYNGGNENEVEVPKMKAFNESPENGENAEPVVMPAVVKGESSVTEPSITFTVSEGAFTQMRTKLGEGEWSAWGDIADKTFTLTEGYGLYNAYFEFKDSEGGSMSIVRSFTYLNGVIAEAPQNVGINDSNPHGHKKISPSGGVYIITSDSEYYPTAVWGDPADPIQALEAIVYSGYSTDDLESLTGYYETQILPMNRISGTNIYETAEPFHADTGNYRVGVRAKQGQYDTQPGRIAEIAVNVQDDPVIYSANYPVFSGEHTRYNSYGWTYLVPSDATITGTFTGTSGSGYQGYLVLSYKDADGITREVSGDPVQSGYAARGAYTCTVDIPEDAVSLVSVSMRIESIYYSWLYARSDYEITGRTLASTIRLTGVPEDYVGTSLTLSRKESGGYWYTMRYETIDMSGSYDITMLTPASYTYIISGKSGDICSGEITVEGPGVTEVPVTARKLTSITFDASGTHAETGSPHIQYRLYTNEDDTKYVSGYLSGEGGVFALEDVPVYRPDGTTKSRVEFYCDPYSAKEPVELYGTNVDEYGILSYDLTEGINTVNAQLRTMNKRSFSGIVKTPSGKPSNTVIVSVEQKVLRGWEITSYWNNSTYRYDISYSNSDWLDSDGTFSFDGLWADYPAEVKVYSKYANGPQYKEISETIGTAVLSRDYTLEYQNYGSIAVDFEVLYKDAEETVPGDCRLLAAPEFYIGYTALYFNGGDNGVYYLNDARAVPGTEVKVIFRGGASGTIAGSGIGLVDKTDPESRPYWIEQTVTLDEDSSGRIGLYAMELGAITTTPKDSVSLDKAALDAMDEEARADALAEATRYENYMYVYGQNGLVGQAKGYGPLTVTGLDAGSYSVISFYLDTQSTTYAQDLISLSDPDALCSRAESASYDGECYYSNNNIIVKPNNTTEVAGKPYKAAGNGILGGVRFSVEAIPLADYPGWAMVKATVMRRSPDVRIKHIVINNHSDGTGLAATPVYNAYVNGEEMSKVYTGIGSFEKKYDVNNVDFQDFDPYIVFFTQVEGYSSIGDISTAVATASIDVTYDTFLRWDTDWSYYGNINMYSTLKAYGSMEYTQSVTASANMDPFDIEVSSIAIFDEINKDRADFGVVNVHVYGLPGDVITIYDGDRKAAEVTLYGISQTVDIKLSDPESFGIHRLRASRLTEDGDPQFTATRTVSLVNRADTIYMAHFRWIHRNDTRMEDWQFEELSDMSNITFRYYPAKPSAISFRLYNVKEGELDNVKFVSTYHDADTEYECRLIGSGYDESIGRYWCEYNVDPVNYNDDWYFSKDYNFSAVAPTRSTRSQVYYPVAMDIPTQIANYAEAQGLRLVGLNYFDYFGVSYELKTLVDEGLTEEEQRIADLENYYKATGESAPDVNALAGAEIFTEKNVETAMASLPATFRDGLADGSATVVKDDSNKDVFSYTMSAGEGEMSYTADTSDITNYDEEAIRAQMEEELQSEHTTDYTDPDTGKTGKKTVSWSRMETLQGIIYTRWVKIDYTEYDANGELAEGKELDIQISREIFAPAAVMNALKNSTTVEEEQAQIQSAWLSTVSFAKAGGTGIMVSDTRGSSIDDGMQRFSDLGTIHGGLDIYNDIRKAKLGDDAAILSDGFNRGMSVLNAAGTAYDISKGVQGRDPQALFNALKGLDPKDDKSRRAINALTNEIMSHEEIRNNKYLMDSFVHGGTTIAGTADPNVPVKVGLLLGGKTYDTISGWTGEYNEMEFDYIMRSIMVELQRQDQRDVQKRIELEKELYKRWERIAEFENWGDIWENEEKITVKQRIIREVEKELNNRFDRERFQRIKLNERIPRLNIYVDPSGYVYEAVPENRVGGIIATIFENKGGTVYEKWVDTNSVVEDRQANPQTTAAVSEENKDAGGRYGWMTPYGTFRIDFTDPNGIYADAHTQPITVPPEHFNVNIGLLSKEAPTVKDIWQLDDGSVAISFSKYMQMESLVEVSNAQAANIIGNTDTYDASESAVKFYDQDGNQISGTFSFPDSSDTYPEGEEHGLIIDEHRVKNTGYKAGMYQVDEIASDWFADLIIFTPAEPLSFDLSRTGVTVSANVKSYAGVPMTEDYVIPAAEATRESAPGIYTIEFYAAEGRVTVSSLRTGNDGKFSALPEPYCKDAEFLGWFTEYNDGEQITTSTVFTKDTTVYAHWKSIEADYILGDVNGDKEVDANDLTALSRHVAKIELITDAALLKAADVTKDNEVDANDLTMLSRYVAQIIKTFD